MRPKILVSRKISDLGEEKLQKEFEVTLNPKDHPISENDLIKELRQSEKNHLNNVLVIGDLHEPFSLDKYLEFCISKSNESIIYKIIILFYFFNISYLSTVLLINLRIISLFDVFIISVISLLKKFAI